MRASYIKALEVQAQWSAYATWQCGRQSEEGVDVWRMYAEPLARGDVFYIEPQFSELTDHARRTVPDDLAFEESWMLAEHGFMLLGKPFEVPTPIVDQKLSDDLKAVKKDLGIGAVSWFKREDGGLYDFMTHLPYRNGGFGCWSYFTLHDGDKVVERMRRFEDAQAAREETMLSAYPDDAYDKLHEIRWVFTAMHLMSQKLAHTREERTSGMARMEASRKNLRVAPLLRVVSLRRMEEERPAGTRDVEWRWQWAVRGHWRKQPCGPGRAEHKQVFVEAYIKGPQSRPLKPPQRTLFVAGH